MRIRMIDVAAAAATMVAATLAAGPALAKQGDPVGGVGVSIETSPGGLVVSTTDTDRAGSTTVRGVKPGGIYRMVVGAKGDLGGGWAYNVVITVKAGETTLTSANCAARTKCEAVNFTVPKETTAPVVVTLRQGR